VYSHNSELWRDLVLQISDKGVNFIASWKDTYARAVQPDAPLHHPIPISGFYSELLYRSWACRVCDLTTACPGFNDPCDIGRVSSDNLNSEEFISSFEAPNKPVIITGEVTKWEAFKKWDWDYLEQKAGNRQFRATSATAARAASFSVSQYRKYSAEATEEAPLYFFDRNFLRTIGVNQDYQVPAYFDAAAPHGTDLFRLFGAEARPDYCWLIIGPKRSGSMFHIDPNQTHAWNAAIRGRKKWIFYPPGVTPPGVMASRDGADVTMPISTGEWLLSFWGYHSIAKRDPDPSRRPLECILQPGELIFVPHNWWHMVINLDESVALTHNYVSSTNLVDCLYFLKHKLDQISGVRDRYGEAVMPDDMFASFISGLKTTYPDLLESALRGVSTKEEVIQQTVSLRTSCKKKKKSEQFAQNGLSKVMRFDVVNNIQIPSDDPNSINQFLASGENHKIDKAVSTTSSSSEFKFSFL
jgi:hypothetical protein